MNILKIFFPFILLLKCFAEDISYCEQGRFLTALKQYEAAIKNFDKCVETGQLSKSSLAKTYRNYGLTYNLMGKHNTAIEYYNKSMELNPADAWNDFVNRGNALSDMGKYNEALEDYETARKIKPNSPDIHYNRGIVFERLKEYYKARDEFIAAYNKGLRSQLLYERFIVYGLINPSPKKTPPTHRSNADNCPP
jgi:tetratricopeptide (TPR) repeat protein